MTRSSNAVDLAQFGVIHDMGFRKNIGVQMDVSNYYPMKELLRDKYFDEGKLWRQHLSKEAQKLISCKL